MVLKSLRKNSKKPSSSKPSGVKPSSLVVHDIPLGLIVASAENPNEQSEKTFDTLVEKIRVDGFDEPVHVVPFKNQFKMVSGHHRLRAAQFLKMETIPAIIHKSWNEEKRQIELVARNQLRGEMNPEKFTRLFNSLMHTAKDKELLKQQMGFTETSAFKKLYKEVSDSLPAKQKQQLDEAKETIKSVDDLSSVINTIFKNNGSKLDSGFLVFSFGGKNHHYIKTDDELDSLVTALEAQAEKTGVTAGALMKTAIESLGLRIFVKPAAKKLGKPKK